MGQNDRLRLIPLLNRLLVCHEEYEKTDDFENLQRQVIAISSALGFSQQNISQIIDSTGNEIEASLKTDQLPRLVDALSNLKNLLDTVYIVEPARLLQMFNALTFGWVPLPFNEAVEPIELEMNNLEGLAKRQSVYKSI